MITATKCYVSPFFDFFLVFFFFKVMFWNKYTSEFMPSSCAARSCLSILKPAEVNEKIPVDFLAFELGFDCT